MALDLNIPAPVDAPVVDAPVEGGSAQVDTPAVGASKQQLKDAFYKKGADARANMTKEEADAEGSASGSIEFVTCIGNPKKLVTDSSASDGEKKPQVVGYIFKSNKPITIKRVPFVEHTKDAVKVNFDAITEETVEAGVEFKLNLIETALLLSRVEYAGKASGGAITALLISRFAQSRTEPQPALRRLNGEGSIKSGMVLIGSQQADGSWAVNPGFESFSNFFDTERVVRSGSKAKVDPEKEAAAAFRALYAAKGITL